MWEAEYQGTRKTLAAWGMTNVRRRLVSLDTDTVTFMVPGDAALAGAFGFGETIKFFRDDTQWFVGTIVQTPSTATGGYEGDVFVVAGPWWEMENLVFQKSWTEYVNPLDTEEGTTTQFRSHVILNLSVQGAYQNTTVQIQEALQWCLDCAAAKGRPAPFQIGTIDLPLAQPYTSELVDRMCAEVIHKQIGWTPDAVGWFDYSTSPPTFNLKQRSALRVTTLASAAVVEVQMNPRYDIQIPSVVIKYEATDEVNGVAYSRVHLDVAPPGADGRELRALVSTVNLEGSVVSYTLSQITCAAIETASADWWKAQHEPLNHETVKNLVISGVVRQTALPRELKNGNVTGWMLAANQATAVRETITAMAAYEIVDASDPTKILETRKDQPISIEIVATNLTTGSYRSSFDAVVAEPIPAGLATFLYTATSILHYDGSFSLSEDECEGQIRIGDVVNLSGLRAEYSTMNAEVQTVSESIDGGRTVVTVGPPRHLGQDDIINFLKGNRGRVRVTGSASVTRGISVSASPVSLGKETPIKNSNASGGGIEKFTVAQHIVMDRADNPASRPIRLRELTYCDRGTEKKVLVLASDLY